jgi:hypothetical protein
MKNTKYAITTDEDGLKIVASTLPGSMSLLDALELLTAIYTLADDDSLYAAIQQYCAIMKTRAYAMGRTK